MNKLILILLFTISLTAQNGADPTLVELSRNLSRDLFELNGNDIMQPSAEIINVTSNDRFFYDAYVPKNDFYVKFGIHMMTGVVPQDMKTFSPEIPNQQFNNLQLLSYVDVQTQTLDTAGFVNYLFQTLLYDGINSGQLVFPESAATLLGSENSQLDLPEEVMVGLAQNRLDSIQNDPLLELAGYELSPELRDSVESIIRALPDSFPLTQGGGIDNLIAGVPQLEIGSFYGTELLVRFIPKLNYGTNIGNFGFWGIGVKHNISQYFYEEENPNNFHLAFQFGYQGTSLDNTIGVTGAELESSAQLMNFNLHASKNVKGWFNVWSGISYETVDIDLSYKYYIPIELQLELGMTERPAPDQEAPNMDDSPQLYTTTVTADAIKFALGLNRSFGPVDVFAGYSFSRVNIFNFGIVYNLNFNKNE